MRSFLLIGLLSLTTSVSSSAAAEFYQAMKSGQEPNHLVPIPASGDYENKIAKLLFLTDGRFGRMIVRPSFSTEYCLSVHADISEASIKKHEGLWSVPDEEKTYVITVSSASKSIWNSLSENGETNKNPDIGITRVDRKISLDLAVAIQRVWAKALYLTHYPSGPHSGFDGTTYQFSVWVRGLGDLQGETWSPKRELPLDLVGIGSDLINFVRQTAKGKELTEQELIKRLEKIESKIPKA